MDGKFTVEIITVPRNRQTLLFRFETLQNCRMYEQLCTIQWSV